MTLEQRPDTSHDAPSRKSVTNVTSPRWGTFALRALALTSVVGITGVVGWLSMTSGAFVAPDASMAPGIFGNDEIHADFTAYGVRLPLLGTILMGNTPERGDVVLLSAPSDTQRVVIRRVVAIGGDSVQVYQDGTLDVGRTPLRLCPMGRWPEGLDPNGTADGSKAAVEWLDKHAYVVLLNDAPNVASHCANEPCVVPPGHVFVVGDNRLMSEDSRTWGFVANQQLIGKVIDPKQPDNLHSYRACLRKKPIHSATNERMR